MLAIVFGLYAACAGSASAHLPALSEPRLLEPDLARKAAERAAFSQKVQPPIPRPLLFRIGAPLFKKLLPRSGMSAIQLLVIVLVIALIAAVAVWLIPNNTIDFIIYLLATLIILILLLRYLPPLL